MSSPTTQKIAKDIPFCINVTATLDNAPRFPHRRSSADEDYRKSLPFLDLMADLMEDENEDSTLTAYCTTSLPNISFEHHQLPKDHLPMMPKRQSTIDTNSSDHLAQRHTQSTSDDSVDSLWELGPSKPPIKPQRQVSRASKKANVVTIQQPSRNISDHTDDNDFEESVKDPA
jgi:hypothetical protein